MPAKSRSFFYRFPGWLDDKLNRWDLRRNRIDVTGLHRWGFLRGYSSLALLLPIPILVFLAYGLLRWRGMDLLLACTAAAVAHVVACRFARGRWLPRIQWLILLLLGLGVWFRAEPDAVQADPTAYRTLYAWIAAVVLTVGIPASRWWANWLIARRRRGESQREKFRNLFVDGLQDTQLYVGTKDAPDEFLRIVRAFFLVPVGSLLLLSIVPAAAVVLARPGTVQPVFLIALAAWWAVLACVHYSDRLRPFQDLFRQALLIGGPLVVSLVVIVLAAARLAGISYVTTVLDEASWVVLVSGILALYLLFWLYDYWVQRAAAEVILGLLTRDEDHPTHVAYREGRLQIHGAGRFLVLEPPEAVRPEKYHTHRPLAVFHRIHDQLRCKARAGQVTWREVDEVGYGVAALEQKVRLYAVVPMAILLVVTAVLVPRIFQQEQSPGLDVAADAPAFHLSSALEELQGEPVYAVAASGGGTRAALYSYSVLRGLTERGLGKRVVLLSSVSGGSLGVSYFAAFREHLAPDDSGGFEQVAPAWQRFRGVLAAPYIQQVLAASGEWRFVTGARLGQSLTESFERCFYQGRDDCPPAPSGSSQTTVGELGTVREGSRYKTGLGLIFNAAVTGSFDASDLRNGECRENASKNRFRDCATKATAGSRLAVTNLSSMTSQSVRTTGSWPLDFRYAVVRDPAAPLAAAASLSANFPPIFSNAAVAFNDGDRTRRYWVTDGGAVENRGIVSLLLGLRAAITQIEDSADAAGPSADGASEPAATAEAEDKVRAAAAACDGLEVPRVASSSYPPIRVLVAEASGTSIGYQEDRGLGAKGASSRQIANKLTGELAGEVNRRYCALTGGAAGVEVIYLPMPETLRIGFGTNWEMPDRITVRDPGLWYQKAPPLWRFWAPRPEKLKLSQEEILEAIDGLYAKRGDDGRDPREELGLDSRFWEWAKDDVTGTGQRIDPRDRLEEALNRAP